MSGKLTVVNGKGKLSWVVMPLLLAMACPGWGQEKDAKPDRRLRLLAVGDVPPFRQEIRDGIRYELDAPEGSVPPQEIGVVGEGIEPGLLRVQLKRVSNPIVVPGAGLQAGLQADAKPWHQLKVPEGGDMLALIWRDPQEGTWDKARSMMLRDGPEFSAGVVRFVNICPVNVGIVLGRERVLLKPGAVETRKVGVANGVPLTISYAQPKGGGSKRVYSSALVQNRGERATVVVYRADGNKPRSPVKVIALRESVPPPLKPEKKTAAR